MLAKTAGSHIRNWKLSGTDVAVGTGVGVAVGIGVGVAVGIGVGVAVGTGVGLGNAVGSEVGVSVGTGSGVDVAVGATVAVDSTLPANAVSRPEATAVSMTPDWSVAEVLTAQPTANPAISSDTSVSSRSLDMPIV